MFTLLMGLFFPIHSSACFSTYEKTLYYFFLRVVLDLISSSSFCLLESSLFLLRF